MSQIISPPRASTACYHETPDACICPVLLCHTLMTHDLCWLFSVSYLKESMGALKFCCGNTMAGLEFTGSASLLFRYMSFSQ